MSHPVSPTPQQEQRSAPASQQATQRRSRGGVRRAHMTVSQIDPWSALKVSFLFSVGLGLMIVLSAIIVWNVLDTMNVFGSIEELLDSLGSAPLLELMQYFEFGRVVSFSIIIAVLDVVLFTIFGVIMALLYNLIAMLVGGVHITITDE